MAGVSLYEVPFSLSEFRCFGACERKRKPNSTLLKNVLELIEVAFVKRLEATGYGLQRS